jgi:GAF domain-containing protein
MSGTRSSVAGNRDPAPGGLAAVRRVTDDRTYLYELIQTIGSGPDLDSILRGVARLVVEAVACHACFIYLRREDSLELRVAPPAYRHLEGQVSIPVGEGLTGWVAKTRRSAYIREHALEDPRVRRAYFPELGDEVYQSLMSAPILTRDGDVTGVITLHAEAPHEFARSDVDFLEHTASLIVGALENAHLYEAATAKVTLLTDLSRLSRRIASAATQTGVLRTVTEGVRELLGASRCEILLLEPDGRLRLAAADPARSPDRPIDARTLWLDELEQSATHEAGHRLGAALWGDVDGTSIVSPLVAGDERLGVAAALLATDSRDAGTVLDSIAAHTAVALKQHQVIETLRERTLVKDFFQALTRRDVPGADIRDFASKLGCDLDVSHVVIHIVPSLAARKQPGPRHIDRARAGAGSADWQQIAGQAAARLAARFPGLLVDRLERSISALVPLNGLAPEEFAAVLRGMTWGDPHHGFLAAGVSRPCRAPDAYANGFEEAISAAELGALMRGGPGVTTYEELGAYRYVLGSTEGSRDQIQQRLGLLVAYDERRGTGLVETLEAYLDHRGNVVGTARALYIHPNTLRQRLERIKDSSGIDLERDDWLSLAIATKVVKLRMMRETARVGGGNDG